MEQVLSLDDDSGESACLSIVMVRIVRIKITVRVRFHGQGRVRVRSRRSKFIDGWGHVARGGERK